MDNFLLIHLLQKAPWPSYNHKESDNVMGDMYLLETSLHLLL